MKCLSTCPDSEKTSLPWKISGYAPAACLAYTECITCRSALCTNFSSDNTCSCKFLLSFLTRCLGLLRDDEALFPRHWKNCIHVTGVSWVSKSLKSFRSKCVFKSINFWVTGLLFFGRHLRILIICIFPYAWILSIHTQFWLCSSFTHFIGFFNRSISPSLCLTFSLCFFWIFKLLFRLLLCTLLCWLHGFLMFIPFTRLSFLLPVLLQWLSWAASHAQPPSILHYDEMCLPHFNAFWQPLIYGHGWFSFSTESTLSIILKPRTSSIPWWCQSVVCCPKAKQN